MAPIDYSKWDNIDTDSEGENFAPKTPIQKAKTAPASSAEPSAEPASTGLATASGTVQAVIDRCDGERRNFMPWSATTLPTDHPVFSQPVPPVARLIRIPLVLHRVGTQSANQADLNNQIATYLNIDATSGFAPPEWQSYVGTVIAARKDRKTLLPQHLEGVWMYCDHILDIFGEGEGAPRRLYNRAAFEEWWKQYCEEQEDRPGKGGERDPDDWRAVSSPYEV